jgi:hypothetical protein
VDVLVPVDEIRQPAHRLREDLTLTAGAPLGAMPRVARHGRLPPLGRILFASLSGRLPTSETRSGGASVRKAGMLVIDPVADMRPSRASSRMPRLARSASASISP